jgi:DNA polymerase-3 subunit gamma/tau
MVIVSAETGQPTVKAQSEAHQAELKTGVRADPLVQAVLAKFPGAEIVDVRKAGVAGAAAVDETGPEPPPVDDGSAYGADWHQHEADDS